MQPPARNKTPFQAETCFTFQIERWLPTQRFDNGGRNKVFVQGKIAASYLRGSAETGQQRRMEISQIFKYGEVGCFLLIR